VQSDTQSHRVAHSFGQVMLRGRNAPALYSTWALLDTRASEIAVVRCCHSRKCLRERVSRILHVAGFQIDEAIENRVMRSIASQPPSTHWLSENGAKELELLLRAIVIHPSVPILLTDDDRHKREASVGASRLLGLPSGENHRPQSG
jgi:hypothetical protein